ncbi:MAG: hypothetical protein ACR2NR_07240 [Solirubrobacteraceae bacterium]
MALLQALAERLASDGLHLGRGCVEIEERRSAAELRLADGSIAHVDVIVGADGVHSVVRPHVVGDGRTVFSGTVGYRGLVPAANIPSRDALFSDPYADVSWIHAHDARVATGTTH